MNNPKDQSFQLAIVGAGISGLTAAILFARRGYSVTIFEKRGDHRIDPDATGHTINFTLSARGLQTIRELGIEAEILKHCIPLHSRAVHLSNGSIEFQKYGTSKNEILYSISRKSMTKVLLKCAEEEQLIKYQFNTRCVGYDSSTNTLKLFYKNKSEVAYFKADVIIGTDGAFSRVRRLMHRGHRANLYREYSEFGYKELLLPPEHTTNSKLDFYSLHVWPLQSGIIVALPNLDKSFTMNFIMPMEGNVSFESLKTTAECKKFLDSNAKHLVRLFPKLADKFAERKSEGIITIKTDPWHYRGKIVLVGDACHAVAPFLGQGMNAAFEDCSILIRLFDKNKQNFEQTFKDFEALRKKDTDALSELSNNHMSELTHGVKSKLRIAQNEVDLFLNQFFPSKWMPLYSMIAHTTLPYSEIIKYAQRHRSISNFLILPLLYPIMVVFKTISTRIK